MTLQYLRPDNHEKGEKELRPVLADIVDAFRQLRLALIDRLSKSAHSEEDVTNVHGQKDRDTNVRQVANVRPSDQPESHSVL